MASTRAWLGRSALLVLGLSAGGGLLYRAELSYRVHETQIATRPVFDPPGLKYAQITGPGRYTRGWVVGMTPPPARPEAKRIIAVGDSLTWGLGVAEAETWPAQLMSAVPGTEVYNLGMCGYDVEQGVSLIRSKLQAWKPDLVIYAHYTNDVDPTFLMFGAHDKHPVFVGTSIPAQARLLPEAPSLWLARHSAWFRQVQAAQLARVLASGVTPERPSDWYPSQLSALRAWSETTHIPVLVLALPDHTQADPSRCTEFIAAKDCSDQVASYAQIAAALEHSGLDWVDGQAIYAASGQPHFMGNGTDTGHPSPEGHRVIAQGLAPHVIARLVGTD
jgi:lysophospholipase L1-like esterase